MSKVIKFIKSRTRAVGYTIEGLWRLVSKEESIQVQLGLFFVTIALGFYFQISTNEWLFQILAFGLIFITESLNTSIEEICNYVQPNIHPKIKEIKDIAAGAVLFSAIFAFMVIAIIYIPKIF